MNWLDIAVLGILVLNIGLGWFKGLIRSVTNLVSVVLGFILAKMYYSDVYDYLIEKYDLLDKIKVAVSSKFSDISFPESGEMMTMSSEQLSQTVGDSSYLQIITEKFFESDMFSELLESNVSNFSEIFAIWLSDNILTILSMVIIFLVVFISVRILGYVLNKMFKLPVLNGVNKLSGFVFGLVKGCFFAMLFVLVLVIFGPIFDNLNIIEVLESSQIAIYFYKYNMIMFIFESII